MPHRRQQSDTPSGDDSSPLVAGQAVDCACCARSGAAVVFAVLSSTTDILLIPMAFFIGIAVIAALPPAPTTAVGILPKGTAGGRPSVTDSSLPDVELTVDCAWCARSGAHGVAEEVGVSRCRLTDGAAHGVAEEVGVSRCRLTDGAGMRGAQRQDTQPVHRQHLTRGLSASATIVPTIRAQSSPTASKTRRRGDHQADPVNLRDGSAWLIVSKYLYPKSMSWSISFALIRLPGRYPSGGNERFKVSAVSQCALQVRLTHAEARLGPRPRQSHTEVQPSNRNLPLSRPNR